MRVLKTTSVYTRPRAWNLIYLRHCVHLFTTHCFHPPAIVPFKSDFNLYYWQCLCLFMNKRRKPSLQASYQIVNKRRLFKHFAWNNIVLLDLYFCFHFLLFEHLFAHFSGYGHSGCFMEMAVRHHGRMIRMLSAVVFQNTYLDKCLSAFTKRSGERTWICFFFHYF